MTDDQVTDDQVTDDQVWSATTGVADGVHVVLVHGSLDRSAGLLKLSRRLDQTYRVTRLDRRGYGRSAPHRGPFGIEHQVDDLRSMLAVTHRSGERSVIFGHSYGGNVALAYADRYPDDVIAVAAYESPASWQPWWPNRSAGADAMEWRDDPEEAAERFMRRLIGDDRWDQLPASTREARRSEGPAMIGELTDLRQGAPWSADRIGAPTLVMYGEFGHDHHRSGAEWLGRELADVEVHMVPGARHFGPNTHPDLVAERLHSFIQRALQRLA